VRKILETLTETLENAYALVSIEKKGVHVGKIKGLSLDANDVPVVDIDINLQSSTNVQHPNLMTAEKMKEIEGYLKRVEGILAKHTESQSDCFAYGLRLCDCIRAELNSDYNNVHSVLEINTEYRGLCKNYESDDYDALFITSCSEVLCKSRTREKALSCPKRYDATDIILQKRTVKTYKSEWE